MKSALRGLCCAGLLACLALSASAATTTMKGMISDSMCGMSHAKMIAGHGGTMTDKQCTAACVKAGAKYVFVANKKVYNIQNQNLAALQTDAGESVMLTGDFNGSDVTVSKVAMAAKAK